MTSVVELRVLEGPNLYFSVAAVKLTLNIDPLSQASTAQFLQLARRVGLVTTRPGDPGSAFRQRVAARLIERLVRALARESGTSRLAVRVRPGAHAEQLVVAYPWRNRARARRLGEAVGAVLDAMSASLDADIAAVVDAEALAISAVSADHDRSTITPRIPVVAVTGTNGKTTTSRMIAHIARGSGFHVGWSNTDGIYVDGALIEAGDYSGPSGAGTVLRQPGVNFAVTETARGGILFKGIGLTRNDVSVVTNVTADHLGLQGIDTLDQLAEVKAVVPRITRKDGWAVLNADDPRVYAMRSILKARPWVFTRDPSSPAIHEVLTAGGRVTTLMDGWLTVLTPDGDPEPLVPIEEVPMTLAGLSRFNVENALAAASAALAAGISREHVVAGLRTFAPDLTHNPGRMNFFSLDGVSVVIDLAHNEAGLEALLEIMAGVRHEGARLLLGLGAVGDRQDEVLDALGELAGRHADMIAICHKLKYLRGRDPDELAGLLAAGAARVGMTGIPVFESEIECLAYLVSQAHHGDVIGLMCHAQRDEVYAWLAGRGATVDTPADLRRKVAAAQAPAV